MCFYFVSMLFYAECCELTSPLHTLSGVNIAHKCQPLKAPRNYCLPRHIVNAHVKNAQIHNNYTKYGMNN